MNKLVNYLEEQPLKIIDLLRGDLNEIYLREKYTF